MAGRAADRKRKTTSSRKRGAAKGRGGSGLARDFYGRALDEAARIELDEAAEVEGLDHEIALLRTKLRDVLEQHPEDLPLMLRGMELLVKAVTARYRLSKEAEHDLAESLGNVIRGVGGLLMPEAFEDA